MYIQLEKCDVPLQTHATLGDSFNEASAIEALRQMCLALEHLHANGIAHMDIKPDNIYLLGSGDEDCLFEGSADPTKTVYKLGDFGQATRIGSKEAAFNEGDARFIPHEIMNGDLSRLDKADMFSLGATIYDVVTKGCLPSEGQAYQDLRAGKLPLLPTVTRPLYNMIK